MLMTTLLYNPDKCKSIAFPKHETTQLRKIVLNDRDIDWYSSVEHLGHILNESLSDKEDIDPVSYTHLTLPTKA